MKKPNFDFERREREKAKAAKKAEKAAAKAASKAAPGETDHDDDGPHETSDPSPPRTDAGKAEHPCPTRRTGPTSPARRRPRNPTSRTPSPESMEFRRRGEDDHQTLRPLAKEA